MHGGILVIGETCGWKETSPLVLNNVCRRHDERETQKVPKKQDGVQSPANYGSPSTATSCRHLSTLFNFTASGTGGGVDEIGGGAIIIAGAIAGP